ncbi:MAG: hypothetical protein OEY89_17560 [Gammaproteobacteria bacterium]|nr:hypothetical protein [Gammaproteobacteria bacterium]
MNNKFSDEYLNAFIDNELSLQEMQEVYNAFRLDEKLRKKCCELQKTRELIKLNYQMIQLPEQYQAPIANKNRNWFFRNMAAGILILVGSLLGWFSHQQIASIESLAASAQNPQNSIVYFQQPDSRVLLHVTTSNASRLNTLLDETEAMLKQAKENDQSLAVEILANGGGLELVNDQNTEYNNRLVKLQQQYSNLMVSACAKAIESLENEQGFSFPIMSNATVVSSSINELIKRQQEGWTYIQI